MALKKNAPIIPKASRASVFIAANYGFCKSITGTFAGRLFRGPDFVCCFISGNGTRGQPLGSIGGDLSIMTSWREGGKVNRWKPNKRRLKNRPALALE